MFLPAEWELIEKGGLLLCLSIGVEQGRRGQDAPIHDGSEKKQHASSSLEGKPSKCFIQRWVGKLV